jgi:hypothetical protein
MHAKNNRLNKNFQIAYFLAGSCHTADGAYSLLCDLKEDREMALAQLEGNELRLKAKIKKAEKMIESSDEIEVLEGEAELADIRNNQKFQTVNIIAAKKELDFINQCIERIQPHRKYSHLPDDEAHEAIQHEEWKLELIRRVENLYLTSGNIPAEELNTLRKHPAFMSEILPAIENMKMVIKNSSSFPDALVKIEQRKLDIPLLLGINTNE